MSTVEAIMEAVLPAANAPNEVLERKIFKALAMFPILLPSQLQIALGTNCQPRVWRPMLRDMIERGIVVKTEVQVNEKFPDGTERISFHGVLCLKTRFDEGWAKPIVINHPVLT